jgi:hypothetical protein
MVKITMNWEEWNIMGLDRITQVMKIFEDRGIASEVRRKGHKKYLKSLAKEAFPRGE